MKNFWQLNAFERRIQTQNPEELKKEVHEFAGHLFDGISSFEISPSFLKKQNKERTVNWLVRGVLKKIETKGIPAGKSYLRLSNWMFNAMRKRCKREKYVRDLIVMTKKLKEQCNVE